MNNKIRDYAYAGDREITEFHIPEGTECIGRHAFYNCRSLHTVYLPHGGIEIEDGASKNCPKLSHIIMADGGGDCTCLRDILYDMYQEITVSISYPNNSRSLLLFPGYEYEYIANEPARIFQEVGYGAGYLYQQCFYNAQVDYQRYDGLWSRARVSEEIPVLARILSFRLRFPYMLSKEAGTAYRDFWKARSGELLTYFIRERDMDSLRYFLETEPPDGTVMKLALSTAQSLEIPSVISYLLDLERRDGKESFGINKFDL